MSRKFLILPLMALFLAASAISNPAMAQKPGEPKTNATTVKSSKSNGSFKVTAINASAGTFTGISKGKVSTFIAPKGALPVVGKVYDITYTESTGGGPLQATVINNSKSNNF